jgi:hypothetical protein
LYLCVILRAKKGSIFLNKALIYKETIVDKALI